MEWRARCALTWPRSTRTHWRTNAETLRAFFKQLREALLARLVERIYNADGSANKHWLLFAKRKFLGKEFV